MKLRALIIFIFLVCATSYGWVLSGHVIGTPPSASWNPLTDPNLVGLWLFENDGTDETANANDLTGNGTPTFESSSPTPQQGTYSTLLVPASNQFWSSASTDFDGTGAFSFGGWFYAESSATSKKFGSKHGASGNYGWIIKTNTSNQIEFGISSNGTAWSSDTTSASHISLQTWTHVVCVYDGSYKRLYVDGSEVNDGTFPVAYSSGVYGTTTADFMVGESVNGSGSGEWDGNIDEAFYFNRALTAAEVSQLHSSGFGL